MNFFFKELSTIKLEIISKSYIYEKICEFLNENLIF